MRIETYLNELTDPAATLRSGRLSNLSGLDEDERQQFAAVWPGLPRQRRHAILDQLLELAEDNPELDFHAVFLIALEDPDPALRRQSIEGLWERQDRGLIPPLARLLREDPDTEVRAAAALALGRFVLRGEFGELRPRDRVAVAEALGAVVRDAAGPAEVRARALEALGACSEPWVRGLIQDAYDDGDDRIVVSALHAMGRSADSYWLPTLFDELQNLDPRVRYEAAGALGEIEDAEAVPYLVETLDDEDQEVQEAAFQALGQIGGPDARVALRERLQDPDERVRAAAQAALDHADFDDDPLSLRP